MSLNKNLIYIELMVKFEGRLFAKQFIPFKPSCKWDLKFWSLCDSRTGYLLKFEVYTGKSNLDVEGGLGSKVVTTLMKDFLYKEHVVYIDNFFSNFPLFESLQSQYC